MDYRNGNEIPEHAAKEVDIKNIDVLF